MEVMEDHVHVFISAPPRYSPSDLVQILKSISAREIFKKFPRMKRQMWSGKIWSDGYFVRSVGDLVTAEIIRKYIEYQNKKRVSTRYVCLKNLRCPAACCGVRHFARSPYAILRVNSATKQSLYCCITKIASPSACNDA